MTGGGPPLTFLADQRGHVVAHYPGDTTMSMTDLMEERILTLIFENTAAAEIGDAAGLPPSVGANAFACGLYTATVPDTAASMAVSEATYTGYLRLEGPGDGTDRNSTDWDYAASPNGPMTNLATITFGTSTTTQTITSVALGEQGGGATTPFFATDLDAPLVVNNGITPSFAIGALDFTLT